MMDDIFNFIHREIDRRITGKQTRRLGEVTSYDKKAHAVKLKIQPEGHETGWVPLNVIGVGNKWGVVIGAEVGDQYEVDFQEGDFEVGRITARVHSDVQKPPEVESGEVSIISHFGHSITLTKDGQMHITTTKRDTPDEKDNTAPHITVNTTAGNMTVTAKKANSQGGQVVHTSQQNEDGTGNKHTTTLDPSAGITHTSTDGGSNTHTISLNPSSGISSTSTAAISHSAGTTLTQTAGSSITHNAPTVNIPQVLKVAGSLAVPGLGSFASNAAAAAGGVPAGSVFVSSITNALMVRV